MSKRDRAKERQAIEAAKAEALLHRRVQDLNARRPSKIAIGVQRAIRDMEWTRAPSNR